MIRTAFGTKTNTFLHGRGGVKRNWGGTEPGGVRRARDERRSRESPWLISRTTDRQMENTTEKRSARGELSQRRRTDSEGARVWVAGAATVASNSATRRFRRITRGGHNNAVVVVVAVVVYVVRPWTFSRSARVERTGSTASSARLSRRQPVNRGSRLPEK